MVVPAFNWVISYYSNIGGFGMKGAKDMKEEENKSTLLVIIILLIVVILQLV